MPTLLRTTAVAPLLLLLGCPDDPAETSTEDDGTAGSTTTADTDDPLPTASSGPPDTSATTGVDSTGDSTGDVLEPEEIEVEIDGRMVFSGDSYLLDPPGTVDATGPAVTVEIRNIGDADLTVDSAALTEGDVTHFALDDSALESTVVAGDTTSFSLTFAPTHGGRKSALLVIANSDPTDGEEMFTIELIARTTPNTYRDLQPVTSPSARFNMGMTGMGDGRAVLFGGRQADGSRVNDTWVFDDELGDWTELSPATSPSTRDTPALAPVGDELVVLFGGTETSGPSPMVTPRDDTWLLDLTTGEWTELSPGTSPPARFQHAMVGLGDGRALLYGGRPDFAAEFSDTWVFDAGTETWTELSPPTDAGPRSAFGLAVDGDRVVLFGGTPDSAAVVDETWVYDIAADDWSQGTAPLAGPRFNHSLVWLEGGGFVTFGGKTDCCTNPVPGTWAYDADADDWIELTPESEPDARFSHRMVHLGRDKALMFGGLTVNASLRSAVAESWEYVGP